MTSAVISLFEKMIPNTIQKLNDHMMGPVFYYETTNPVHMMIKETLLDGYIFCPDKFSKFILDESKRTDVKIVMNALERQGVYLSWINSSTKNLNPEEAAISDKIKSFEIQTYEEFFAYTKE